MKKILLTIAGALSGMGAVLAQDIIAAEYAIDTDNGLGNNTLITFANPAADGTFDFQVNTNGLSRGYHTLYVRTLDANGLWSHTSYRTIEILDDVTSNLVEGIEFFENTLDDFGTGNYMAFSNPQADGSFVLNFPYAQVTPGNITLWMRAKDTKGLWSFPVSKNFTIVKQNDPTGIPEISGSYFSIYPNPANEVLTVELNRRPESDIVMQLIDINGKVLISKVLKDAKTSLPLKYAPGNYFLVLNDGQTTAKNKITIAK